MTIIYNVTGPQRKALAMAIGGFTEETPKYLGMPSAAYRIGEFYLDKEGSLTFSDFYDAEELIEFLAEKGFEGQCELPEDAELRPDDTIEVSIPGNLSDGEWNNLLGIIKAKGPLIKKALGVSSLPAERKEDSVAFGWLDGTADEDKIHACASLAAALVKAARSAKRVTMKEKESGSERYDFRCFLLRLGFIGDEYKRDRKILLAPLSGSSAFRGRSRKGETA